jgi:hypothetical protein
MALNLHTPGALPPQFLSIAFSGVLCMAVLLPWGVLMPQLRRPSARAHSATIWISDAGFSRFVSLFLPAPTSFHGTYLCCEGGNVLLILLMFLWDWKRNRIMKQFLWGALLVTAVVLSAKGLYFNETWKSISRSWPPSPLSSPTGAKRSGGICSSRGVAAPNPVHPIRHCSGK